MQHFFSEDNVRHIKKQLTSDSDCLSSSYISITVEKSFFSNLKKKSLSRDLYPTPSELQMIN